MRLNFLLHDVSRDNPFGGIKQQYELANRLADLGYDVAIYHSLNFEARSALSPRSIAGLLNHNLRGRSTVRWFALNDRVRCLFVPRIKPALLRSADVTIMSSARVAERVARRTTRTGRLVYVVYEFPVWRHGTEDLRRALIGALKRHDIDYIASSFAVEEMLGEVGTRPVAKITCGIDLPDQRLIPSTLDRDPVIGFALRPEPYKGAQVMLEAIRLVSRANPQARFECFGRFHGSLTVPENLHLRGYLDDDELMTFYRRCMIFVSPSYAEGWGLTAAEAMANGAAVVVTEDGGSRDFAINGETAMVVPPRDPSKIASAIAMLLVDKTLRQRVVEGGLARGRAMGWEEVVAEFDAILSA